ncbi:MAG: response regulator [Cytophagaceae bacterium]|nr:response regulator [Cytophagaceae bacterium]
MLKFNQVLLIDDDKINNFINEKIFKKSNCVEKIHSALNGEEALAFLSESTDGDISLLPDLILLDINMPVMDGVQFMEKFREVYPDAKTAVMVMLTTTTTPEIKSQLELHKVSGFIQKPLNEEKIKDIVSKYCSL